VLLVGKFKMSERSCPTGIVAQSFHLLRLVSYQTLKPAFLAAFDPVQTLRPPKSGSFRELERDFKAFNSCSV